MLNWTEKPADLGDVSIDRFQVLAAESNGGDDVVSQLQFYHEQNGAQDRPGDIPLSARLRFRSCGSSNRQARQMGT